MTIFDTIRHLLGFGHRGPREDRPARHTAPLARRERFFLCGGDRFFLCGGDRVCVGGDALLGEMRQTILDQRLLEKPESRIYRETPTPVPGVEEYVVVYWWIIISTCVEVKYRGPFAEAVARLEALRRRDPDDRDDYTLAHDVTDRVLAAGEGGDA